MIIWLQNLKLMLKELKNNLNKKFISLIKNLNLLDMK